MYFHRHHLWKKISAVQFENNCIYWIICAAAQKDKIYNSKNDAAI